MDHVKYYYYKQRQTFQWIKLPLNNVGIIIGCNFMLKYH